MTTTGVVIVTGAGVVGGFGYVTAGIGGPPMAPLWQGAEGREVRTVVWPAPVVTQRRPMRAS
ncbi:MAG: hypothetical protein ACFCVK_03365 [Acidimicrobiales bacterium]